MLESLLQKHFGFTSFKNGQRQVIDTLIKGESAAAIFPTGAGKSLCYQLPAMVLPGLTLVVSPLLSLMKDQVDFLLSRNIPAARLDSTLDREEYNRIMARAKNGELKILMISVERFKNERFRYFLSGMAISLLVIDEAHCISEWGHNFRPDYLKLPAYQRQFRVGQTLVLTATATPKVIDDMCEKLDIPRSNVTLTGFYRSNLFLQVTPLTQTDKANHLARRINQEPLAPTIVYVILQKTAQQVAGLLKKQGIHAAHYHAGMPPLEREEVQNRFFQGDLTCVVATIAFGMGIDKRDIRRVIHYDLPKSIENYSQEIGRAGRDGNDAFCEVLANRDAIHVLENFVYGDTPEQGSIDAVLQRIKSNQDGNWEISVLTLANELNIRVLPLKTLLVYLEIQGIIAPKFTYYKEYSFKFLRSPEEIIHTFQEERQAFVRAVFEHCQTKKVWTMVDMDGILRSYSTDRKRVVTALEYFDEKGWLQLKSRKSVELYEIKSKAFDTDALSQRLHHLFKTKEEHEIQRIESMIRFFESDACLSARLARYFGQALDQPSCGHCSFCTSGRARIKHSTPLEPLSSVDFSTITRDFMTAGPDQASVSNLAKFLCGIHTPVLTRLKVKSSPGFGALERYRFQEVKEWLQDHLTGQG
ncbi:MAG: RecQ family ATP-dependent DNA helicase [Desulfobacteraceae bacterium]|nr:RecQ family ATP-dependent DNA helicase [Desulfobacteraceae bacterium]